MLCFLKNLMFNNFFFYKIMLLDYLIAAAIIFPVLLDNTVHQNIEKKILNFFFEYY